MAAGAYERWARGDCPCCGSELDWWPDVAPEAIAEGVMICGRCVENEHLIRQGEEDFLAAMLESIARRDDGPMDRLLPGTRISCRPLNA